MGTEPIRDVTFIIIAFNEELFIRRCLESLAEMDLEHCEIICVDAGSTDSTIEIINSFRQSLHSMRVFQFVRQVNAATARNKGIREARKPFLYFVDGDVSLNPGFMPSAVAELARSESTGIVYGKLEEWQYSKDCKRVVRTISDRMHIRERTEGAAKGGIFMTKKSVVEKIGLFDEHLRNGEDRDFSFRALRHYDIIGIPVTMGCHHTVPYRNIRRSLRMLGDGYYVFFGILFKKHMNCRRFTSMFLGEEYGIVLGGLLWPLLLASLYYPWAIVLVVLFTGADILLGLRKEKENIPGRLIIHYFAIWQLLWGMIRTPGSLPAVDCVEL